jgi:hypothetical protein
MRIWSLHPKYLDTKGLVALWRETLLAKKVLEGNTKGYKNHPQLNRFKASSSLESINFYLYHVYLESKNRGYNFDVSKIDMIFDKPRISVNIGQMNHEFKHLLSKTETRNPEWHKKIKDTNDPMTHPLFNLVDGPIENWEIV